MEQYQCAVVCIKQQLAGFIDQLTFRLYFIFRKAKQMMSLLCLVIHTTVLLLIDII